MFLALLVFVSHISRFEVGRPAVFVFFILSGYWVVRLFDQSKDNWLGFGLNRFLRVWPLLAVTSALIIVASMIFRMQPNGSLLSTLALFGLSSRDGDLTGVSWSLDIEAQFYVAVPLIAAVFRSFPNRTSYIDLTLIVIIGTSFGAILLSQDIWTVAAFLPLFAAGAVIHLADWRSSRLTALFSILSFAAVGLLFALVPELNTLLLKNESDWWRDLIHMVWCLLLTPFISYNVHLPSSSIDRHLGNLSFPFYLVHPFVINLSKTFDIDSSVLGAAFALALTLLAAVALYAGFDRPLEHVRHRLMRRKLAGRRPAGLDDALNDARDVRLRSR